MYFISGIGGTVISILGMKTRVLISLISVIAEQIVTKFKTSFEKIDLRSIVEEILRNRERDLEEGINE